MRTAHNVTIKLCWTIHDGCYSIDFHLHEVVLEREASDEQAKDTIASRIIAGLKSFEHRHRCKFVGVGLTEHLLLLCPKLSTTLWLELDIIPAIFSSGLSPLSTNRGVALRSTDDQADSMVRKCVMFVLIFASSDD